MAHIKLTSELPGIKGLLETFRDTAKPLTDLAELLLVGDSPTFSKAERETVANYVSYLNGCVFCSESHAAVADFHWDQPGLSRQIWENPIQAPIPTRLKKLLAIAAKVQRDAKSVAKEDVAAAIAEGATERDVHDAILIAAAFCLYNRYVDGMGTFAPARGDPAYLGMGRHLAEHGYRR